MSGIVEAREARFRYDCDQIRGLLVALEEINVERHNELYLMYGFPPLLTDEALLNYFGHEDVRAIVNVLTECIARMQTGVSGDSESRFWTARISEVDIIEVEEDLLNVPQQSDTAD